MNFSEKYLGYLIADSSVSRTQFKYRKIDIETAILLKNVLPAGAENSQRVFQKC